MLHYQQQNETYHNLSFMDKMYLIIYAYYVDIFFIFSLDWYSFNYYYYYYNYYFIHSFQSKFVTKKKSCCLVFLFFFLVFLLYYIKMMIICNWFICFLCAFVIYHAFISFPFFLILFTFLSFNGIFQIIPLNIY